MNIRTCNSCRVLLFCTVTFLVGGATTTQGQQQDTNNVTLLIADVNQLKDKVKTQEDIILRANSRISELERQLTEQTKQNNKLQLLCEKAGIKITEEPDENSSPNQLKDQKMNPNPMADETKDADKIERVRIKIDKMFDAIELDNDLPPVYVPHAIRGLSTFPVVYCRGEGPDEAEAEAIHVAANDAGVLYFKPLCGLC